MAKRLYCVVLFALVAFVVLPSAARPCDCASAGSQCQAFASTPTVFVGRVVSVTATGSDIDAIFEVTQAYRGMAEKSAEILTFGPANDCGYQFKKGVSYLVYAVPDAATGKLRTGACQRTRLLSEAKDEMVYWNTKDDPVHGSGIVGDITMQIRDAQNKLQPGGSAAGIGLVISGVAIRLNLVTHKDGTFEVWGLAPGAYRASPVLPEGFLKAPQTVKLAAQSCEEVHFLATPPPKKNP